MKVDLGGKSDRGLLLPFYAGYLTFAVQLYRSPDRIRRKVDVQLNRATLRRGYIGNDCDTCHADVSGYTETVL